MKRTLGPLRSDFQPWEDPSATPFVDIQNVTKRYGDVTAVNDQSLTIYEREFFALLGPSGCGKTTLLRMLAGLEVPNEGAIRLEGQDITHIPPHKRPVNMMFQSYALFPHMSVEKNIAFGLKQEGMPAAQIAERVSEMLKLVKLENLARRKPDQLSGGQRQRVALARALAKRPKVLLLDEPLGALDRKLREETQFELTNIQERLGLTFVIVTHDQEEAMTVADRIAVMDHGEIVQVATPAEIYEAPATRYIADFIGDINLFHAIVHDLSADRLRLGIGGDHIAEIDSETRFPPGAEAWFAIRPEKISLAPVSESEPLQANQIRGKIWDIGYLGDMTIYHVRLEDGAMVRSSQLNDKRALDHPLSWEDDVVLSWQPDAGILLER